jgi:hypothetical protein
VTRISDITGSSMVWRRTIQSKPWWNNGARRIDVVLNVESTGFRDFAFSFPLFVWWGFWDFKPTSRASPEEGKRGYFLRSSAASSAALYRDKARQFLSRKHPSTRSLLRWCNISNNKHHFSTFAISTYMHMTAPSQHYVFPRPCLQCPCHDSRYVQSPR